MPAPTIRPPKEGPLRTLILVAQPPRRWDRVNSPGYGVDLTAVGGDDEAIVTVFGATAAEATQRARDLLHALARSRNA